MARKVRKKKSLLRWYAAFGFSAFLIAFGVFWLFGIMYQYNTGSADSFSAQINFATVNEFYSQNYTIPTTPQFPVLGYVSIALVCVGAACFVASKFFYEKSKE
jgi:hypothetical protein